MIELDPYTNVIHYKEIDSTNNEAKKLINNRKDLPYWIIADKQTSGRGRKDRFWDSPIGNFVKKNPKGGMHHICIEVEDINAAINKLNDHEVAITGTGKPKIGAHGKPVVFLHPKDCNGTLIELEEV